MEQEIAVEAEILIQHYIKASSSMVETQNYFLNGIQAGPTAKSYLLTGKGVEVLGEEVISVPEFIESVLSFAYYSNKKIEVLMNLAMHLQKINQMITDVSIV